MDEKRTLLVVDDEPSARKLLSHILTPLNFSVLCADAAPKALEIMTATPVSLVITDLKMPGEDGLSLIKKLKINYPDIPVILMSAHGDKSTAIRALRENTFDYLDKPFEDQDLIHAVKRSLKFCDLQDEKKRMVEQLKESEVKLHALSERLITIQEEERKRVSRDIHDELGQLLAAFKLDINWLLTHVSQEPLIKKLSGMSLLLRATVNTVRRITSELRPHLLDHLGLESALMWYAEDFRKRSKIRCQLYWKVKPETLSPDLSNTLFRIVQEGLTNVTRHSEATQLTIHLLETSQTITLKIEDNGSGFQASDLTKPGAFGLLGIKERVFPFGGAVEIKNKKKGTLLTVDIPK